MKRTSQFHGSFRAIMGLARLTMRELIRTGAAPISFFIYVLFLALFRSDARLDVHAASSRFIDHGLGGAGVATMFLAVFFGMQLAGRGEGQSRASFLMRRSVGPASYYWGRLLGMSAMLVLFGLMSGALLVMHHAARFGAEESGFKLESRVVSTDFSSTRDTRYLRKKGESVSVPFEIEPATLRNEEGRGILVGRFAPTVVLLKEMEKAGSDCIVRLKLRDRDSDWAANRIIRIHQGRAQRFEFKLPKKSPPSRVMLDVESRTEGYLLKFRQDDLQLITRTRSFFGGLMRASLSLSLLASILATFALFFREHMALGPSLVAGFGLVVLCVSVELLEFGVLAEFSSTVRESVLAIVTTVLPDAGYYDVIQRLARGRDIGWDVPRDLLVRLASGSLLLGLIAGWFENRRLAL